MDAGSPVTKNPRATSPEFINILDLKKETIYDQSYRDGVKMHTITGKSNAQT